MFKRFSSLLLCLAMVLALGIVQSPGSLYAQASDPQPEIHITLNKQTVAVGETINGSWTIDNMPEGWHQTHTWFYTDATGYRQMVDSDDDVYSSSFTPPLGVKGELRVDLWGSGSGDGHISKSASFTITGDDVTEALTLSLQLDADKVAIGSTITASWTATGGKAPYTYAYQWSDGAEQPKVTTTETSASFTPGEGAGSSGFVRVMVTDAAGRMAGSSQLFGIIQPAGPDTPSGDPVIHLMLDKATVAVGRTIKGSWSIDNMPEGWHQTHTWFATDATGYMYVVDSDDDVYSSSFTPPLGVKGELRVDLWGSGSGDGHISKTASFTIAGDDVTEALTLSLQLDADKVAIGSTITASWTATGGKAPYTYAYQWSDGAEQPKVATTETSASFTPGEGAGSSGFVRVLVTDAAGRMAGSSQLFGIIRPAGPDTPSGDPVIHLMLDKATVAVGRAIKGSWSIDNMPEGWHQTHTWIATDATGYRYVVDSDDDVYSSSFTPPLGVKGELRVDLWGSGSGDGHISKTASFTIAGDDVTEALTLSLQLDADKVAIGSTITASWTATGGKAPYTYAYQWSDGAEQPKVATTETSASFTPGEGAGSSGFVRVLVTDAAGRMAGGYQRFEIMQPVEPSPTPGIPTDDPSTGPLTLSLQMDPYGVAIGRKMIVNWTATGGKAPYTYQYQWSDGGDGPIQPIVTTTETSASFTPTVIASDTGSVRVQVTDAAGSVVSRKQSFEIMRSVGATPAPGDPVIHITLDKQTVAVGETITASWTIDNLTEGWYRKHTWTAVDSTDYVHVVDSDADVFSSSFTPPLGARGHFGVVLFDDVGNKGPLSQVVYLSITGDPVTEALTLSLQLDAANVAIGSKLTANWTATGGKAPYTYQYQWSDGSNGAIQRIVTTTETGASFIPTVGAGNTGSVSVQVTDATGRMVSSKQSFKIIRSEGPLPTPGEPVIHITLNKQSVAVGETVKATWSAQGGTLPYTYVYQWISKPEVSTTETSAAFTPKARHGGTGSLRVDVTDAKGRRVSETQYFKIKAVQSRPPATTPFIPLPTPSINPDALVEMVEGVLAKEAEAVVVNPDGTSGKYTLAIKPTSPDANTLVMIAHALKPLAEREKGVGIRWIFRPTLVLAARQQGFAALAAQRETVRVVLPMERFKAEGTADTVVQIRMLQQDELPEAIGAQVRAVQALSDVYRITVSDAAPDELLEVSFLLDAKGEAPAIAAGKWDSAELGYPEAQIVVDEAGNRTVQAMIPNEALCLLVPAKQTP